MELDFISGDMILDPLVVENLETEDLSQKFKVIKHTTTSHEKLVHLALRKICKTPLCLKAKPFVKQKELQSIPLKVTVSKQTSYEKKTALVQSKIFTPVKPSPIKGFKQLISSQKSREKPYTFKKDSKLKQETLNKTKEADPSVAFLDTPFKLNPEKQPDHQLIQKTLHTISPPKIPQGVFPLYWIVEKMRLEHEFTNALMAKEEVSSLDTQTQREEKNWIDKLKEAVLNQKSHKNWSVATRTFSWFTSFTVILTGCLMMTNPAGLIGGSFLIAGGVLNLANHVMEATHAWEKIASSLPYDSPEKRRAVVIWLQVAFTVVGLVTSGIGALFGGGLTLLKDHWQTASSLVTGAILIGIGVCEIGKGIYEMKYCSNQSQLTAIRAKSFELKSFRKSAMESSENHLTILEDLFDSVAEYLRLMRDLFYADQQVLKRS